MGPGSCRELRHLQGQAERLRQQAQLHAARRDRLQERVGRIRARDKQLVEQKTRSLGMVKPGETV